MGIVIGVTGEYINKSGKLVNGDQSIFFAQLKDAVPFKAGEDNIMKLK